ncbi:MAG: 3-deoxy-D-manno-octulosonic acid transferase [Burkholderiaceae bacterium]|jgi:3-deoxy-D-manno-octulosonic-acid transferase|nr:3-deoxy-D-manno-octulosonic acid transferase [Burkholderiaceae bacterium]
MARFFAGMPLSMQAVALFLYSLLAWLAQPLLRRKLARRALAEPLYGQHVAERFGHYTHPPVACEAERPLWIHAVSLGETRAAAILIEALRAQRPGLRLLLTHGTATGRAEGAKLLRAGDMQVWQPWDTPAAVRRFLRHFQPRAGVLMETEVWPNLAARCAAQNIPLALANARLSAQSWRAARRWRVLARPTYARLAAAWPQSDDDARRLQALGAPTVAVLGNLKFDARPDAQLLAQGRAWRATLGRPVVLLASAREGEEADFLAQIRALAQQREAAPEADAVAAAAAAIHWLIVPRHPQRFDAVAQWIEAQGLPLSRRSQWADSGAPDASASIWLGDSLGEMPLYYALADVALLGGSFAPLGGQNLIEAAACGCPLVMGPHTFNFAQAARWAIAAGAACAAPDMATGVRRAAQLIANAPERAAMVQAAQTFASAHRGAATRTAQAVLALLPAAPARPAAASGAR